MYEQPPASRNGINLSIILIIVLGLGALVFALLAVYGFSTASAAKSTLNAQKQAAAAAASDKQKQADADAAQLAAESPYRSYVAPEQFGAFEIKFPKNWDGTVAESLQDQTQVLLTLSPDFVRRTNGTDDLAAAKVTLLQRTSDSVLQTFASQVKKGSLKQTPITVSGINSVQLSGNFTDHRTVRLIIVPIRDKTLTFTNEVSKYGQEFDQIIAQAKINP